MKVTGVDERDVVAKRQSANLVVFLYEGGDQPSRSWSVDSYLLAEADLHGALVWLSDHLDCCWSLGAVSEPATPATGSELTIDCWSEQTSSTSTPSRAAPRSSDWPRRCWLAATGSA